MMTSPEATEPPSDSPAAPQAVEAKRRRTVRFVVVLGLAAIVAVAAILAAVALNQSSGGKPRAGATTSAGPVIAPGNQTSGSHNILPPLAIVLERTDSASSMTAAIQVIALRQELATKATSTIYQYLGQVYMALGDQVSAQNAFAHAAALAPNAPEPLVGLAMTEGMSGTAGLARATKLLTALETRFPNSQVVTFNLGWLAIYRTDVATIRNAWARTAAQGPKTALGSWAAILLSHMSKKTPK